LSVFDLQSAMLSELIIFNFEATIGIHVINGLAIQFLGSRFMGIAGVTGRAPCVGQRHCQAQENTAMFE